jgi:hypothetical protein
MVDRLKLETMLTRRFPKPRGAAVRAAADAIMGITDGWEELLHPNQEFGYHHHRACCSDVMSLTGSDIEFRILQRSRLHVVPFRRLDHPVLGASEDAWR